MDIGSGAEVREDQRLRSGASTESALFGPGSMTWRVHADPVFAVGGVRALIMQALHPLTMAAVAQQRGFEEDFWGRLDRTGRYVATLTYAPETEARRLAARIRGIHRKLRGTDPVTGEPFRLDRPDLLLWVHCCEVDSFLSTARRAGAAISPSDADEYLREQVQTAELIGIPGGMVPATVADMAQYFHDVRPQLRLTDEARRGVRVLAVPPMPKRVKLLTPARPAWATLATLAFALLPKWGRRLYRLPGLPTTDLAATGALRAIRAGVVALPDKWTGPPEVVAARAEMAAVLHEEEAKRAG
ncbi:MAG: oxygenase MpaB family protein [Nakamurella sp.]